jgi:Flp pilus assembly protein TadD
LLAQHLNQKGLTCIEEGEYETAESTFREALEADLFCPAAHNNLGVALLQSDEPGALYAAAWEFQFAAKLAAHSAEPRHNLGIVMERANRLADAEDCYREALEIDPHNVEVMCHLARVYVKTDKRDASLRDLLRELAYRSDDEDWNTWARQWLIRLGNDDTSAPVN